jgi:hypothetical protein
MRTRTLFAGLAVGAALLAGGSVTTAAHASPSIADSWIYVGTYSSLSACQADGRASVYADWDCKKSSTGKWQLWVDDES